ncbi:hypothetical protein RB653_004275 [Dictyostelium firmibasis]|uniref:FNIP repeat-containing protein n=1 Tax=Dictyostelium firmibasis TaxID=79012 RepID=A0AAN7UA89_9MYCE
MILCWGSKMKNNNNSNNNSNNNNNNNTNNNNEHLFFKIWRNKYIRFRIFHQIKKHSINRIKVYEDCSKLKDLENSYYIKRLKFLKNSPISVGSIPNSVRSLKLSNVYSYPFLEGSLPPKIKNIYVGQFFNLKIDKGIIPSTCETIRFGYHFNQSFEFLPPSVTSIEYGSIFNKPETIPPTVTRLKLFNFFNRIDLTENDIPRSIKFLIIDGCFNINLLAGFIPSSVTKLVLGPKYFQPQLIPGFIPSSVRKLTISLCSFETRIEKNVIPSSVRKLKIIDQFSGEYIASNLKYDSIPFGVESIEFSDFKNKRYIKLDHRLIPLSVKKLTIKGKEINLSTLKYNSKLKLFFKNYYYQTWTLIFLVQSFTLLFLSIFPPSSLNYFSITIPSLTIWFCLNYFFILYKKHMKIFFKILKMIKEN